MSKSDFPVKVVAFLDVLGFESLIQKMEQDSLLSIKIYKLLSTIHSIKHFSNTKDTVQSGLNVSVFSDSIAISTEEENYINLIWTVIGLQAKLLAEGILCRGGVAKGMLIHQDDLLYGPALVRAYKLESKTAIYPRVIVDTDVIELMPYGLKSAFLLKDNDGINFLNPFCLGISPDNFSELFEDGHDVYRKALDQLENVVENEIESLSDIAHRSKWEWLRFQLKKSQNEYDQLGAPRVMALSQAAQRKQI
jgi:hypothetical protein